MPLSSKHRPRKEAKRFGGLNAPKLPMGREAGRSGGLGNNFDRVGIIAMCRNLDTEKFSLSLPPGKQPQRPWSSQRS